MTTITTVINQLKPFSAHRFDACMNYLMRTYEQSLTQHDIVKLHVMIDFFHVLETGKQTIGGPLNAWKHGPVIKNGYNRIKSLGHRFDIEKKVVREGKLRVFGKDGKKYAYGPYDTVDESVFSSVELQVMKQAWGFIMPKTFNEREQFFHESSTYMGRVWEKAKAEQTGIDWCDLVDAFDEQNGQDHSLIKMQINLWRES